jgi:hypothetical protein
MMLKTKTIFWLVSVSTLLSVLTTTTQVQANCADSISPIEEVQPAMERYWQQLQQRTDYPWGKARPYGELSGNRITLTPEFDRLSGSQKQQVLSLLKLDTWPTELLTPEEQTTLKAKYGEFIPAAMSPYEVFASDGRAVSLPYSGCDRFTLLTEKARYSWYYNRGIAPDTLRNAGQPSWRQVRFPISVAQEKAVRLKFWKAVGYQYGGWIAWVPEHGYFEINVPNADRDRNLRRLQRFWQVASPNYRYVVVDSDGTLLR